MSLRATIEEIVPAGPVVALEASAARIGAAGRAAWPGVVLTDDVLATQLATRWRDAPEGHTLPTHEADFYLSVALAHGNPAALRVFETQLVPQIALALRRLRLPVGATAEVVQLLRVDLLVGDPAPRIVDYGGRGELAAWLRVTAARRALKLLRHTSREQTLDDALLSQLPDAAPDPALHYLRATYAAAIKEAVQAALAGLAPRQRNLLRQHVLDGLTIDELASLYRVHRATCARWLAEARADLARGTRRQLVSALEVSGADVDSVLRALATDIELSIARLLKKPQE
jgi:RNA polymerase sigma-70 factor (ECF subfamily)